MAKPKQFIARGWKKVGAPAQRKRMNALGVNRFFKGTKADKSIWGGTLTRNGFHAPDGVGCSEYKGCKATKYVARKGDKRVPYGWAKRVYWVTFPSYKVKQFHRSV